MNILYYLKNYPKLSQSFVLNEISELERRGHNVAVFARLDPGERIQHEEYNEFEIPVRYAKQPTMADAHSLLSPKVFNHDVLRRSMYRAHPKDHAKRLHLARQCIEYIEELDHSIDHIHCHFAHPNKFPATYAAAYHGIPCTVTAHAYEIFQNPNVSLVRKLLARMDRVVVPSQYNRSYIRERFEVGIPIDVVPATTRVSKFEPTDNEVPNRLLTVARLVEKKGVVYAIEAIAKLAETHPDIEYHIVGTGELEAMLRQRAADLGVANRITFLGHVSDERLQREFDEASAFVLPCVVAANGDRDGSPVAIKEAMAMRTPCVSTTVTGIPEMIEDEVNGRLVEPHDTDALATAIAAILDDEKARKEMGEKARETIRERYSLDVAVDKLVTSFRESRPQK